MTNGTPQQSLKYHSFRGKRTNFYGMGEFYRITIGRACPCCHDECATAPYSAVIAVTGKRRRVIREFSKNVRLYVYTVMNKSNAPVTGIFGHFSTRRHAIRAILTFLLAAKQFHSAFSLTCFLFHWQQITLVFTMMDEAIRPDSDSLMALQALLKFRSGSMAETEETVLSTYCNKNNRTASVDAAAANNDKPNGNRKRPAPPLMKQHVPQGQILSHVTPPFGAMSPRSALSPSLTLNYDMQQNNAQLASAPYSPVVSMGPVEPVAVPSSGPTLPNGGNNQGKNAKEEAAAAKPVVRTTEIEAALRSKPQRGRKRDNLSELERLELTRTRNREHAKSTR